MTKEIMELKECLAECYMACSYCFGASLREDDVKMMARCIKLDKECAEICIIALSFVSSDSQFKDEVLGICFKMCEACAAECRKHDYEHCEQCAAACEKCADACRRYLE